jgi:hypothetical protein
VARAKADLGTKSQLNPSGNSKDQKHLSIPTLLTMPEAALSSGTFLFLARLCVTRMNSTHLQAIEASELHAAKTQYPPCPPMDLANKV